MDGNINANLLRCPEAELFRTSDAVDGALNGLVFNIRAPFHPYSFGNEPDWTVDPFADKTWCLYFHSLYWLQAIDAALREGPENRKSALKMQLKKIVISFAKFIQTRANEAPHDIWDDHATSYRLSHLAYTYASNLEGFLSPDEEVLFLEMIHLHVEKIKGFLESDKWALSNHTLFQIEGIIDASYIFYSGKEKQQLYKYAVGHFEAWLKRIVDFDIGSVKEHAAFYHIFLMARISDFITYFEQIVGKKSLPNVERILRNMARFFWHMSIRFGQIPAIGDTKYRIDINSKYLERFKSFEYLNPHGEYLLSQGKNGVVDRGLAAYHDDGFYFVRNGSYLNELFTCFLHKPYIGPHGHVDGLSFETYFKGKCIFTDSGGPYKYGNKLRYQYFRMPLGHNCVVVNDGQQVYTTQIERVRCSSGVTIIKGTAKVEDGVRWVRGFVQLRNHYIVVIDLIDAPKHRLKAYARFQIDPELSQRYTKHGTFELSNDDVFAELGFFCDFPENPKNPVNVENRHFLISECGIEHEMHEHAYITRKDSNYEEVGLCRSALVSNSLHVSACSFVQPLTLQWESEEGTHKCVLTDQESDIIYKIAITERRKNGIISGFALSANIR